VRSEDERSEYAAIHPLLRVESSALILVDPASVITDAGGRIREVCGNAFLRVAVDVGGTMDAWTLPVEYPILGWPVSLGVGTLVGPVSLEWGKASTGSGGMLSVSLGRLF